MRLLHVEDNQVDADLVSRALHSRISGVRIDHATTLNAARELLIRPERFDLALIDLRLPDGNGLELLNEIRGRDLPLAVVMLTGSGDHRAAIASLQSGADDYVPKAVEAYARLPATITGAQKRFSERISNRSRMLHVLYAEHNAVDIDLTQRHLARQAPYIRLTVVPDAVVALGHLPLDRAHQCDYDVLLLDYRLPGIDALDAVRTIRNELGLDIPIVIVSGQGSEEVAARALQLGVDDYIAKHSGYLYELAPTLEKVHRQAALLREQGILQETSCRLAYMLEASPVVLYTIRFDGESARQTGVNANITRLFGYTEQEAMQPDWWLNNVHPDDKESAVANISPLVDSGQVQRDYRFFDKAGRIHWIRDELQLIKTTTGGVHEVLGAWHDISDQKRSEQIQQTRIAALDSLVGGETLNPVLHKVAEQLEAILPDMRVSILLRDVQLDRLYTAAAPSLPESFNAEVDGLRLAVGYGSCGTSAALGEPVIVDDVRNHPYWASYIDLTDREGIRACWAIPFKDESGAVLGTLGIYHDKIRSPSDDDLHLIGEFARIAGLAVQRANAETKLRQAAAVFNSTREGVVITDLVPRIIAVNPAYTEITGYDEADVIGCNPAVLQSNRQDEAFYQSLWANLLEHGYWQGEIWNRRKNGEVYPQLLAISTVRDSEGAPKNYVGVMTDISQIKKSEANLQRLAHYDPLTDLPNRLLIHSRLEHALAHGQREGTQVAVLFLDLDRFKNVNDSLGHPVGDHLLRALTRRLHQRVRGDDTFGRLGGDEFLIILDSIHRPEDATNVARKLIQVLEEPFELPNGKEIYVGASIGISLYPQDGEEATTLIQHADAAMYQAKEQGRNTLRFYTPALTAAANKWMEMESHMRRGLSNGEFILHYQPQVEIESGRLMGCEALLRWDDPVAGLVSPADFIPLAEDTGLMIPLGEWVLHAACAQYKEWLDKGMHDFCISINLSGRQLQQHDIVAQIAAVIEKYKLPADRIKFELTESMLMGRGEEAATLLNSIKALGVRISIDDFGTGYSSLAYLKRFPIDELKIDRSFVRDIPDDFNDAEIAAMIIAMARHLRLRVVAEGVETQEQADFLAAHGCEFYQGYLFRPPLPAEEFEKLASSSRDTRSNGT